jgi:hypothetical protein
MKDLASECTLLYSRITVCFNLLYFIEEQGLLNEGKGLILCHIRKVNFTKESPKKRSFDSLECNEEDKADTLTQTIPRQLKIIEQEKEKEEEEPQPTAAIQPKSTRILYMKPINVLINNTFPDARQTKADSASTHSDKQLTSARANSSGLFKKSMNLVQQVAGMMAEKEGSKDEVLSYVELYKFISADPFRIILV